VAFGDKLAHHHLTIDQIFGATKTDKTDFQACVSKRECSSRIPLGEVKLLLLAAIACATVWSADLCPPGKSVDTGGVPGEILWRSYAGVPRPGKFCIGNQVRNEAKSAVEIRWKEAGIERALVKGELQIAECCFDGAGLSKATLQYGSHALELTIHHDEEEGLAHHEEGYPDLIDEDARMRIVSIRGTLSTGGQDVRIDILLKCTASQFAKQFAYQYSVTDRSTDPIEIKWDLIEGMQQRGRASVQAIPSGKTYLFLSDAPPQEKEGRITLETKSGAVGAVFRLDGFAAH
jgi:hypothetical protein